MIDISTNQWNAKEMIIDLANELNASFEEACEEFSIDIDHPKSQLGFRATDLPFGISLMLLESKNDDHLRLNFRGKTTNKLFIAYVNEGQVTINDHDTVIQPIKNLQMIVFETDTNKNISLDIAKGTATKAVFIILEIPKFHKKIECDIDGLHPRIRKLFTPNVELNSFQYFNYMGVRSGSILTNLFDDKFKGLERRLMIESYANRMISDFMNSYNGENDANNLYKYSQEDIDALHEIHAKIYENPESTFTVKELARLAGINTSKLQKGFRMLYGVSIRQFIIKNKLQHALKLLKKQDASIGAIAGDLGYINKGHFTSMFNKEFGMLPSEYKKLLVQN